MNNTVFRFDVPQNERVESYAPGTPARAAIKEELARQAATEIEIPLVIGGKEVTTGRTGKVVMPTDHRHVLATYHMAGEREVARAIDAALAARAVWGSMSWVERASITLKAAELLSTKRRALVNAATMLGQGKSVHQAEIDAACEVIDYLRYNAYFASEIYANQPRSGMDFIAGGPRTAVSVGGPAPLA
jgi:1-pyrroline-5-carboxylate dehydrogenase